MVKLDKFELQHVVVFGFAKTSKYVVYDDVAITNEERRLVIKNKYNKKKFVTDYYVINSQIEFFDVDGNDVVCKMINDANKDLYAL